jgi:pilus assembly protein CpaB
MNRQKRTLIVLVISLGAASVASYGVYAAIASIPERRVEIATKHAVVAASALPVGTLLAADSVKLVDWPEQSPLNGGFSSVDEVVNRGLIAPVVENEPLTETKLAPKDSGAGLPPTISPGMRAMSVKVNEVIGVAGFVVPGTRVDVLTIIGGD